MSIVEQPILQDFQIFLDYISTGKGIELTKTKQVPRTVDLLKLNELVHFKAPHVNNKSQIRLFSLLNAFFHISKVSELTQIRKEKGKFHWFINPEKVAQLQTFSAEEQYFFLLESFWCYIDWDAAYDIRAFWDKEFYQNLSKLAVGEWITVEGREIKRKGKLRPPMEIPVVEVFAAFGLLELVWDETLDKRPSKYSFPYKLAAITALGKVMLPIIIDQRPLYRWGNRDPYYDPVIRARAAKVRKEQEAIYKSYGVDLSNNPFYPSAEEEEDGEGDENFMAAFLAAMPDLEVKKSWYPIKTPYVDGQFTVRVALDKKLYRDLLLHATMTLEDLHLAIQKVYEFDNDHLYAFYVNENQTFGSTLGYDNLPAAAIQLGELGLHEGKQFIYLFDFGDDWRFLITVLKINHEGKALKKFKLVESVGDTPQQYPDYEEEDW